MHQKRPNFLVIVADGECHYHLKRVVPAEGSPKILDIQTLAVMDPRSRLQILTGSPGRVYNSQIVSKRVSKERRRSRNEDYRLNT